MSEVIWTGLDVQVVLDALNSEDDVGVFLRGHHLVEQAADQACRSLYENYDALGHDTLTKHLNALAARGAKGTVFEAARIIAKHRRDFAHTRRFAIDDNHVAQLENALREHRIELAPDPESYGKLRQGTRYLHQCLRVAASIEQIGRHYKALVSAAPIVEAEAKGGA